MLRASAAYLKELGELQIVEVLLVVVAKVQADELAVPVEGDVVVHGGLAEDVPHILCRKAADVIHSSCDVTKTVGMGRQN